MRSGPVTASTYKKSGFLFIVRGNGIEKTMTLNITVMVVTVGVHAHLLMPKMLSRMIFSDHLLLWCISYH